jgi:hypothetical protein
MADGTFRVNQLLIKLPLPNDLVPDCFGDTCFHCSWNECTNPSCQDTCRGCTNCSGQCTCSNCSGQCTCSNCSGQCTCSNCSGQCTCSNCSGQCTCSNCSGGCTRCSGDCTGCSGRCTNEDTCPRATCYKNTQIPIDQVSAEHYLQLRQQLEAALETVKVEQARLSEQNKSK